MRPFLNLVAASGISIAAIIAGQPWAEHALAANSPNTWITKASLNTGRAYIGLTAGAGSDTHIYAIGGQTSNTIWVRSEESFTPGGTSWTTLTNSYGTANTAGLGVATGTDAKLYGIGGDNSGTATKSAYSDANPSTTAWAAITAMGTARTHLGAATSSSTGLVYAIGGNSGTTYLTTNQAYSPSTTSWTTKATMPTARAHLAVVTGADGLIYAIGGYNGTTYLNTVEAYNPSTNTWSCSTGDASAGCTSTTISPMPQARTASAVLANGLIYVFGGYNGSSYLNTVEAYNPTTNQWECSSGDASSGCAATPLTVMPTARAYLGTTLASDGNIYAAGGYNGSSYLNTVESYGPLTVPGAPTGVTATAGDSSASVSWTAPASTGGTPVTSYTVSCTPSCAGVSTGSTSATVNGLTNGTSYMFTVTATNFVGTGATSAASSAVTPTCSTTTSNLAVSGAAVGNFSVSLTGSNQQAFTSLGSYTASNTTCSGWSVQFQASRFQNSGGDQFPTGSLSMAAPTVSGCQSACGSGTTANPPAVCIHSASVALDGATATTVASAAANAGKGSYTFTPGTIGTGNLQLTIPSYAYATAYSSTLTVTISQGPAASC